MTPVTRMYAARLVPLLKMNLQQLGKPVPNDAELFEIAIHLVEDLESRHVSLGGSTLSYTAWYYANSVTPGAGAAHVAAVGEAQLEHLLVADFVPIVHAVLAGRKGNDPDLQAKAVEYATVLSKRLREIVG